LRKACSRPPNVRRRKARRPGTRLEAGLADSGAGHIFGRWAICLSCQLHRKTAFSTSS
jgi:hypothetical protein